MNTGQGILFEPILRPYEEKLSYTLNTGRAHNVTITKGKGFKRITDALKLFDGQKLPSNLVPIMTDGEEHTVFITM